MDFVYGVEARSWSLSIAQGLRDRDRHALFFFWLLYGALLRPFPFLHITLCSNSLLMTPSTQ